MTYIIVMAVLGFIFFLFWVGAKAGANARLNRSHSANNSVEDFKQEVMEWVASLDEESLLYNDMIDWVESENIFFFTDNNINTPKEFVAFAKKSKNFQNFIDFFEQSPTGLSSQGYYKYKKLCKEFKIKPKEIKVRD